jgi:hypothetical protein
MASGRLVYVGFMPAIDPDGVPYPDARFTVYVNRTTTLATVYADEALTTPLTNPVLADAAGQFPPVWADQALLFSASITSLEQSIAETIDDLAPSNSVGGAANKLDRDGGNPDPDFLTNVGAVAREANLTDLTNKAAARTALELGDAATKSSATIRNELTTANVTNALTYTPFNAKGDGVNDKAVIGANPSWVGANFSNIQNVGRLQTVAVDGYAAVTAFTRASDNPTPLSQGAYSGGFFGLQNDTRSDGVDVYAVYAEGKRTSGAGTLSTVELAVRNEGNVVQCSPYESNGRGVTKALRISTLNNQHISAAILIFGGLTDGGGEPVGAQFQRGIVFKHGSITTGVALDMAAEHRLVWGNAGTELAEITATQVGTPTYKFSQGNFVTVNTTTLNSTTTNATNANFDETYTRLFRPVAIMIGGVYVTLSTDVNAFVKASLYTP